MLYGVSNMYMVGSLPKVYRPEEIEEKVKEFWKREKIYERIRELRTNSPKFYFLDGPPFPSSELIHVGTAWNKVLKDSVIRFWRMRGYNVRDQPGYDCHGLPIEVAVEKSLKFKSKKDIEKYGVENFVNKCRELVFKNISSMNRQFEDLGVSMDWDNPYLTLNNDYIESGWWLVKRAYERGLLERGLKVMHWCPRCETVLSDYEVTEYKVLRDPSIYVKFPVKDRENEYIVIWTTTPWTLPANIAIMVNPDFDYVRVRVNDEILIMAKERVEPVLSTIGKKYEIIEVFKGDRLDGLKYIPPLLDEVEVQRKLYGRENVHRVVLSREYVHLLEGTGCVHTAPGHGEEDFEVAKIYGLPIISPIDDNGRFMGDAGKYAGMYVKDADPIIIKDLERKNLLLYSGYIEHRYPVCWRCKTPLLFRATKQWFIKLTKIKDELIDAAKNIKWIPKWAGSARYMNWLENLRDWVISRQRYWGTPIPIWICDKCGRMDVIGSLDELAEKVGGKIELKDIHKPWIDRVTYLCDKCGGTMRRIPDVMDVWYDSGASFFASLRFPKNRGEFEKWWPVDFIVEGQDQIYGWFDKLIKSGVLGFRRSPFNVVLMHGFALDEKGREMHKSLGNFVSSDQAISYFGRDPFRLYVLNNTIWEDLKFSAKGIESILADLHTLWNVYVFASIYMNLDKYSPVKYDEKRILAKLKLEDRWVLSRLQGLIKEVTRYMEEYNIHLAVRSLRRFIIEDLSHWYIKLIRRRVWIEEEEDVKITAYYTLYRVLKTFLVLLAPYTPFLCEEIYQKMFRNAEPDMPISIHMLDWPRYDESLVDKELEENMDIVSKIIEIGLSLRMSSGIKIRQPLRRLIVFTDSDKIGKAVNTLSEIISDILNIKKIFVEKTEELKNYIEYEVKPNMASLGPKYKSKAGKIVKALGKIEVNSFVRELKSRGEYILEYEGERFKILLEDVKITERVKEGFARRDFEDGVVLIDTIISQRERYEGLARDIVRRIQFMRKELDLPVDAYIHVVVKVNRRRIKPLTEFSKYISEETRAKKLEITDKPLFDKDFYVKKWNIEDEDVVIGIYRV